MKRETFSKFTYPDQSDTKKSWIELSLLLRRKKTRTPVQYLIFDANTISDDIQMAKAMNDYFASIIQTSDSNLPPHDVNIPSQQRFEQ